MKKREIVRALALTTSLGFLLGTSMLANGADATDKRLKADPIGSMGPVPKAHCGRCDWTESGMQGQTTPWERESGDSEGGYNCNLELVGQYIGEGAKSQGGPAYLDDCAYYDTNNNALQTRRG